MDDHSAAVAELGRSARLGYDMQGKNDLQSLSGGWKGSETRCVVAFDE